MSGATSFQEFVLGTAWEKTTGYLSFPSVLVVLGKQLSRPLSLSLNSAPHLPNSELSLVEAVRHSPLTWLGQTTGLPSCSWKHEQMGWQEQRWLVCASFLGFVASVQSVTRGELFPFGPSARDQLLAAGNDQTHRLELDKPVLFYDGTFDSIFVSWNSQLGTLS